MSRSLTIDKFKRATAKRLRLNTTDAEQRLWRHLKHLETRGTHFRRQMPIGNYVVDFACPAARLVIEVDGSHHGDEAVLVRDENERVGSKPKDIVSFAFGTTTLRTT